MKGKKNRLKISLPHQEFVALSSLLIEMVVIREAMSTGGDSGKDRHQGETSNGQHDVHAC
jgi:hypothetical protein